MNLHPDDTKAMQRITDHIEDRYTVHSRIVARDFAQTRDHMRSRQRHTLALHRSERGDTTARAALAALQAMSKSMGKAHA